MKVSVTVARMQDHVLVSWLYRFKLFIVQWPVRSFVSLMDKGISHTSELKFHQFSYSCCIVCPRK